MVYGRSMADVQPGDSTGIAVCRVERSKHTSSSSSSSGGSSSGGPAYLVATFEQPHTSALVLPALLQFAQRHLKKQEEEEPPPPAG